MVARNEKSHVSPKWWNGYYKKNGQWSEKHTQGNPSNRKYGKSKRNVKRCSTFITKDILYG